MNLTDLNEFAKRYAKAWCSQDPDSVAAFYAEDGSLSVNVIRFESVDGQT